MLAYSQFFEMRYLKIISLMFIYCLSSEGYAFQCYLTLFKDHCWKDYSVSVDVVDSATEKKVTTLTIPANELWKRVSFNCSAKQSFIFLSKFSPAFWSQDEGKVYNPKRYWSLPEAENEAVAWNMNVCFPADFAQVPIPPEANNKCGCDKSMAPAISAENKG